MNIGIKGQIEISNEDIVAAYKIFFDSFPNLTLMDVGKKVAEDAASISAMYRLATPDAIHIASAMSQGATAFVTNDLRLKKVGGVRILAFDDFVE
ncbi:MAG: PIN domain-containing protein [Firmicutes bacterium]|nr:PIN domain-containing protein [Bacillota bacterium]